MKLSSQKLLGLPDWAQSAGLLQKLLPRLSKRTTKRGFQKRFTVTSLRFLQKVKNIGATPAMDDYEKRKLGIFNQLNFFQLVTGILVPLAGMLHNPGIFVWTRLITCLPAMVSLLVLWLNARRDYYLAQIAYFVLYPFITGVVYLSGINLGIELSFMLYGILSVFFLQEISQMLFALGFSMVSYFVLAVLCKDYPYQLATTNLWLYVFNQLLALGFIFYGLFLIKKENAGYQRNILRQKEEIAAKNELLKDQTEKLSELNAVKNKLFSIIAHDLKSPMYALRNLFKNMQQYDLPAEEIKEMVPDVVEELTYTTNLMENLLQWARSQMQADAVKPQVIDIAGLMTEVAKLLKLQAEAKKIRVIQKVDPAATAFADKDMINLVMRNLLSNAIKYTPGEGVITLGVQQRGDEVEIFVQDTGDGISEEALQQINQHIYYTTKGTSGETGTGLGLMLCKEFLLRNGGKMHIASEVGKGSVFSFTLPAA